MDYSFVFKYARYLISGVVAAGVNIGVLYLCTEYGHVYYLLSAVISFGFGFVVSFVLQKFWTFKDAERNALPRQMSRYFLVSLFNLAFNTSLLYVLVEFMHVWYVAAAVLAGMFVAFVTFFVYKRFIFTEAKPVV